MGSRGKKRLRKDGGLADGRIAPVAARPTRHRRSGSSVGFIPEVEPERLRCAANIMARYKLTAGPDILDQIDAEVSASEEINAIATSEADADVLFTRASSLLTLFNDPLYGHHVQKRGTELAITPEALHAASTVPITSNGQHQNTEALSALLPTLK